MKEQFFQCPYCWEQVSILVDLSVTEQNYIEDCENCCNPIQFKIRVKNQEIVSFDILEID
ncbi:CPXCG motif-containing cysteine-rich protein [Aureivirga marina]|uniref:CPXCG motif-containing cysteine-rich protein n=1 Tax=Aureivirga marina TaxID=1182451 RepID=UPI0018C93373|nr:CPXCG motif-containing cysteine-rich protein [Aureivirga marina]